MRRCAGLALLLTLLSCKPAGPSFTNVDCMAVLQQEEIYLQEGLGPLEQADLNPEVLRRGLWPATTVMFFSPGEFPVQLTLETVGSVPGLRIPVDVNGQRALQDLPADGKAALAFRSQKGLNVVVLRYGLPEEAPKPPRDDPVTGFRVFEVSVRGK